MRRGPAGAFSALAAHTTIALWLTWPLAGNASTHLPAPWGVLPNDAFLLAWALAHQSHALLHDPWALPHGAIFHPATHALFYGEAGIGALPLFLPVFAVTANPALALNVTLLAGVALTATALHLVVARWTASWTAGLVAGWTFLGTHWVLWTWAAAAPNYAVLAYLPPIMLLAAAAPLGMPAALALGALVVLQGLVSAYVAVATIAPLAVLAVARIARGGSRRDGWRLLAVLAAAAVILLAAFSGYGIVRAANPDLSAQTPYRILQYGRVDLPWGPFAAGRPTAPSPVTLVIIALGAVMAVGRRDGTRRAVAWRHGALWALVGLVVSLTPQASWNGRPFTLPHAWIASWLPVYDVVRDPGRLGVAAMMGLAVLTGAGFAEIVRWLANRRSARVRVAVTALLAALVGGGIYTAYRAGPESPRRIARRPLPTAYPLLPVPSADPALATILGPPHAPVLEVPVGPGSEPHVVAMYHAILHRRPLVNGYSGYWPRGFPGRMQLACRLPDPDALRALRRATGVESIVVRLGALDDAARAARPYACPPGTQRRDAWLAAATEAREDLRLVARRGDLLVFAAR